MSEFNTFFAAMIRRPVMIVTLVFCKYMCAASWQNQQSDCAPSEDSDQPGHPGHPGHPPSLIRVFAARMKKPWVLSYPFSTQRSFWSDWADAQDDLSLRWAHTHFVGFVMSWLLFYCLILVLGDTICELNPGKAILHVWATSRENLSSWFATKKASNRPAQL